MILRKPFAFFIKHFKFIHLILAICAIYLITKTNEILSFYLEYMDIMSISSGTSISTDLFNILLWISTIVIILGSVLIAFLMKLKKKPIRFYVINIIVYIALIFIYIFAHSTVRSLEIGLVDVRTLKMIQDFLVIAMILQVPSAISLVIRALGFDIKKFDFERDLEELEITSEDNEEIEVNLEFDFDKFKRNVRKQIRHFKYVYFENKTIINVIFTISLVIIGIIVYLNIGVYNRAYHENQRFNVTNYQIMVNDSYKVRTDYNGNIVDDKASFIVISLKLRSNYLDKTKFETARIALEINKHLFYPQKDYKTEFSDLGTLYTNQNITKDDNNYIIAFEIPKNYQNKKMKLKYFDYNDKEVTINIKPNSFKNPKLYNYNLGDTIKLDDSILKNTTIKLSSFEVNDYFKNDYKLCIDNNCIDSYEYLVPTYTGNEDKALIKITGNINWDENKKISEIDNLYKFIEIYGKVSYILNGEEKDVNINLKEVKPNKASDDNTYYIEVNKEVKDASKIYLTFVVRDKEYKYVVK